MYGIIKAIGGDTMPKKIINVKYHQSAIATMSAEDLNQVISDIKDLIGDDYIVIFSPFDFQEIPDEGLFSTVEDLLHALKDEGRDQDIIKIAELVTKFVPAEALSECADSCEYHCQDDSDRGEDCKMQVTNCDA